MRWDRDHRSDDVIDQRGSGGGTPLGAGVGILFWLASRFGLPGLVLGGVILAAAHFLSPGDAERRSATGSERGERSSAARDESAAFVGFVLDDVQSTWRQIFARAGRRYEPAKLVLFSDATQSGCGFGNAEVGPFYCARDRRVYIDLGFFRELERRFGAPGDFAQAYVVAHEIGHHVQTLLGIDAAAQRLVRGGADQR